MNKQKTLTGRIREMKVGDTLSFAHEDANFATVVATVYRINRLMGYKAYSTHVSKLTPLVTSVRRDS